MFGGTLDGFAGGNVFQAKKCVEIMDATKLLALKIIRGNGLLKVGDTLLINDVGMKEDRGAPADGCSLCRGHQRLQHVDGRLRYRRDRNHPSVYHIRTGTEYGIVPSAKLG